MADDLSLLLKIRGDSVGAKASVAETRAAISSLKSLTSSEFKAIQSVGSSALNSITGSVTNLAGQIPVAGSAVSGLTSQMAGLAATANPIGIAVVAALALAGATAAIGKELVGVTIKAADFQGKLFDLSQQTGVAVETLSALEILAKTTGGNIGQITASLGIFQKHLEAAQDPTSKESRLLKELGITTNTTEEALRDTFKALAAMPEGFHQTATALELFGRGGKSILAILKEMHGDLDGAMARFRELGLIVSREDAEAADKFNDQLVIVQAQLFKVAIMIGNELIPALTKAGEEFSTALKNNREGLQLLATLIGSVVAPAIKVGLIQPLTGASNLLKTVTGQVDALSRGLRIGRDAWIAFATGQDIATAALRRYHEEQQNFQQEQRGPLLGDATGSVDDSGAAERVRAARAAASATDLNTIKNAATEAKQIAANQIQIINQMFERGQINRRESILETIRILKISEGQQQEFIVKNLERLEAEKKTATDVAKVEKEIDDLRSQARQTRRQLDSDVAAQESKLLVDQTKQRIQHLHNQTEAYKETADIQIKIIQDRVKAEELTELNGLARITEITERRFAVEALALQRELDLVGRNAEEQEKLRRNLEKLNNERGKTRADQGARLLEIQKRDADKSLAAERRALEVREQQRLTAESRLNRQAENFQALESSALKLQIKNLTANFEERKKLLEQEGAAATTSAERKKDILLELQIAEEEYTRTLEDLTQRRIDARNRENEIRPKDEGPLFDPNNNLVSDRDNTAMGEAPGTGRWEEYGAVISSVQKQLVGFSSFIDTSLVNSLSNMTSAVGQAVAAWALYGESLGKSLQKALAAVLAQVAAEAAIQALLHAAYAIGKAAFGDWAGAARHALAAVKFGAVAIAAGVGARIVAGNSFSASGGAASQGTSSGSSANRATNSAQAVDVSRNVVIQPQIHITMTGQATEGFKYMVEKAIVQSYRGQGEVYDVLGHARGEPGFKG